MLERTALSAAVALITTGTGWSQGIASQEAKLIACDAATDDYFGISVAVSGDTAVVGASGNDHTDASNGGAAYVFVRSGATWIEQAKLTARDAGGGDWFGYSVSVSGDTAVVGAQRDDYADIKDAGSAYVFVRSGNTWTEQAKLTARDAGAGDRLGFSVSLLGDTAVIGALYDTHAGGTGAGSAYVFVRSGTIWTEQAKLTASDATDIDSFGSSVSLSGDTAVVGASDAAAAGVADAGSAYVFVRSGTTWTEQAKLVASDPEYFDSFGYSVSVSGNTAVVGAWGDDVGGVLGSNEGSAYVFVRSGITWSEQAKLTASNAAAEDYFGYSVSVSGDMAMVGARMDDHAGGVDAGSVYAFVRRGASWTERENLTASDAAASDLFGYSVSVSGDTAVAGTIYDDYAGATNAGSAYVFRLSAAPVTYCMGGTSASACQALLSASGTPSANAPSGFTVTASAVEGQKDGIIFWGVASQASPWGGGTSNLCIEPPVKRTGTQSSGGTTGLCDGAFSLDFNTWMQANQHKAPGVGEVVYMQAWFRDPPSPKGTSLSDGLRLLVCP